MNRIRWNRLNVWRWLDRNERAWMRCIDRVLATERNVLKIANHVRQIGEAMLITQRNQRILHTRLMAVESKVGITPGDPLVIVKQDERMNC